MKTPKPWNRELWGVVFSTPSQSPILVGDAWHYQSKGPLYDGGPSHALLFTTRKAAREWCVEQNAEYQSWPPEHPARHWRVRPVRVRERVEVI